MARITVRPWLNISREVNHTFGWAVAFLPQLTFHWWSHRNTVNERFRIASLHVSWLVFSLDISVEWGVE